VAFLESFEEEADGLSSEENAFLQKTARSLVEIQPDLHTITDIIVFLEVLGYTDKEVAEKGFRDLYEFAVQLHGFLDHYVDKTLAEQRSGSALAIRVSSTSKMLGEALALAFPWLSALIVLFTFGVSLWLVWGLPLTISTSLIIGLFLGLIASEGPIQVFQRLFVFHHEQGNLPEVKRILKRSYLMMLVLIAVVAGLLFAGGLLTGVPASLIELSAVAAVTILANRMSYVAIYALRKFGQLVASYAIAIVSLLAVFFLLSGFVPLTLTRYLDALGCAFIVLSIAPIYYGYKIFSVKSTAALTEEVRRTFNPLVVNSRTIRSRFKVQVWESAPYYLYGTLFFAMLFGDRVLAWRFNPIHVVDGIRLPLVFNTPYHLGADLALLVIFPAAIAQYVIMTPTTEQLTNLLVNTRVTAASRVDGFLRHRYAILIFVSALVSSLVASGLVIFAPEIMARIGGTAVSVRILEIAAVSNVFLALFIANGLFLMFTNRAKSLVGIAVVCVCVIGVGGYVLGGTGFENIIYAYLFSALIAMALSFAEVTTVLDKAGSIFLSRYT
jgi:hypothetical protein